MRRVIGLLGRPASEQGSYVTVTGPTDGAPPPEDVHVDSPHAGAEALRLEHRVGQAADPGAVSDLAARVARLPVEQRAALEALLLVRSADAARTETIGRSARPGGPYPLSFSQERLWFLDQLEPGSAVFNAARASRLTGRLDVGALEQSLNEVVRRHEVLRTTFAVVEERPVQVVAPVLTVPLPVEDLREFPESVREIELQRRIVAEARRPFDLAHDALLRAAVWRLAEAEHVLLLTIHHVVFDGWSRAVLYRELTSLYQAASQSHGASLPLLRIQYGDYAAWQRERLKGEALERQMAYWRQQLAGMRPLLELPADRPRPAVERHEGAHLERRLPARLAAALDDLSRRERVTLFMALLASFVVLLHRYTGEHDLVVGTPVAGRTRVETEELIGFFVNTLVLRIDVSGNPTFRELLGRVREVALGAYAHQDLPFEKLVAELQPERSLRHAPLVQIIFALQNAPTATLDLPGVTARPVPFDPGTAVCDLTLSVRAVEGELRASAEYNVDLFDEITVSRLLGHWETLLEGIVVDPARPVTALPLLTRPERQQLLVTWNDTAAAYPGNACLHQLFEAQVGRTPEAIAVIDGERRVAYGELNARANQLAHHLRARGVGPEVVVGLCLQRSVEMVVGLLGILKAGGAYLPLDPTYPRARLAFMVADAGVAVLVTAAALRERLPELGAHQVRLDSDAAQLAQASVADPASGATPADPAYVLYTSGSTGRPKGVVGLHRGAVNRLAWMWRAYPFDAAEVACQKTSVSFVDSVAELLGPLLRGIPTALLPETMVADPEQLVTALGRHRVTRVVLVPSLLRAVLDTAGDLAGRLPTVRLWMSSGEALSRELGEGFRARLPDRILVNLYGSTEVAADATWYDLREMRGDPERVPIGRPIANTRLFVLDPAGQPVPVGVVGELYVGGVGLARGYLGQAELTAAAFVPDPFAPDPGARLYRTGDLARYRADGTLEWIGRRDRQVKVRGFRIELEEIEAALRQHPEVRDAVVVAREEVTGASPLVAYVVAEAELVPTDPELRRLLRAALPDYMVPSRFVALPAVPLTPSGKVDWHALPPPGSLPAGESRPLLLPRDALERQLSEIWTALLDRRGIGVDDSFFDLGGHSLLAVRLVARLEERLGKTLPLATLFRAPTIAQLAGALREDGWAAPQSSLVPLQPHGSRMPLFCVHTVGGNVFRYVALARHLAPDHPVYGLQAQGLDGRHAPQRRVEEMAAHYIEAIRTVQPEGPYALGGLSHGGLVAFEMARQLHAQGHPVALLALLDTYGPGYPTRAPRAARLPQRAYYAVSRVAQRIGFHLESLRLLTPADRRAYLLERTRSVVTRIARARRARPVETGIEEAESGPSAEALRKVEASIRQALRDYAPSSYPGRVVLFRARWRPPEWRRDPQQGWGRVVAGALDVQEVPGWHTFIVEEPRVRVLAQRLRACLRA